MTLHHKFILATTLWAASAALMVVHTFAPLSQFWWEGWSLFVGVVASAVTICMAVDSATLRERLRLEELASIMAGELRRQSDAGVTRIDRAH